MGRVTCSTYIAAPTCLDLRDLPEATLVSMRHVIRVPEGAASDRDEASRDLLAPSRVGVIVGVWF